MKRIVGTLAILAALPLAAQNRGSREQAYAAINRSCVSQQYFFAYSPSLQQWKEATVRSKEGISPDYSVITGFAQGKPVELIHCHVARSDRSLADEYAMLAPKLLGTLPADLDRETKEQFFINSRFHELVPSAGHIDDLIRTYPQERRAGRRTAQQILLTGKKGQPWQVVEYDVGPQLAARLQQSPADAAGIASIVSSAYDRVRNAYLLRIPNGGSPALVAEDFFTFVSKDGLLSMRVVAREKK
jgi:hypothetical protein